MVLQDLILFQLSFFDLREFAPQEVKDSFPALRIGLSEHDFLGGPCGIGRFDGFEKFFLGIENLDPVDCLAHFQFKRIDLGLEFFDFRKEREFQVLTCQIQAHHFDDCCPFS